MSQAKPTKVKPDIRAITRLVPPSGNLVQGQSELPIHPTLAREAAEIIAASQNHYGGSEATKICEKPSRKRSRNTTISRSTPMRGLLR